MIIAGCVLSLIDCCSSTRQKMADWIGKNSPSWCSSYRTINKSSYGRDSRPSTSTREQAPGTRESSICSLSLSLLSQSIPSYSPPFIFASNSPIRLFLPLVSVGNVCRAIRIHSLSAAKSTQQSMSPKVCCSLLTSPLRSITVYR